MSEELDMLNAIRKLLIDTRTVPSTALKLRERSVEEAVDYIKADSAFDGIQVAISNIVALKVALNRITLDGIYAEFGVFKGQTLEIIAKAAPDGQVVHGFDSFIGLPESWGGTSKDKGAFDVGGRPPEINASNVEFHIGFFDKTVPEWNTAHEGTFAFVHLDADLYSSTKTVFDTLGDRFVPGTVVVFDEYFGYHGWQLHEHKAFMEFLRRTGLGYEPIIIGHMNLAVQLTE